MVNIWYLLEEPEEDSSPWEEVLMDLDNDSAWQGNNDESWEEKEGLDQQNKLINQIKQIFKSDPSEKKKLPNELEEVSEYFRCIIINRHHAVYLIY